MLFYYEDDPSELISFEDYNMIRTGILQPMTKAGNVLKGYSGESQLKFENYLEESEIYNDFIESRAEYEILGDEVKGIVKGKNTPEHVLEHMIVSFAKEAYSNNIDADQFKTTFGASVFIHNETTKKHVEKWTQETIDMAFEEKGLDINKMSNKEKDSAMLEIMPNIRTAIKLAQNFNTQLSFAIKNKRLEEVLDDEESTNAFSSNTFMFDPRAAEVLERFLSIMQDFDYTPSMKRAFTASFLNDTVDITKRGNNAIKSKLIIPPTDPVNPLNAILDPTIMKQYYNDYNDIRTNLDKTIIPKKVPSLMKTIEYVKDDFAKKGCII